MTRKVWLSVIIAVMIDRINGDQFVKFDLLNWQLDVLSYCESGDLVDLEKSLDRLPDGFLSNPFVFHHKRKSPLLCAAFQGRLECVKFLVEHEVEVDSLTNDGMTCLGVMCTSDFSDNQFSVIRYLVEQGADVNFVDSQGYSPLLRILSKQHVCDQCAIIKVLDFMFQNGADVFYSNKKQTVLDYSEELRHFGGPPAVYDFVKSHHDSKLESKVLDRLIAGSKEMDGELCF